MRKRQHLRSFFARLGRDRTGVAAVELGLVAPVIAALVVPMVDLGIGAFTKMRVQGAAEAAAQYALANPSNYSASAVQTAGQNATGLASVTVTPTKTCNCITSGAVGAAVGCATTCADGSTPGSYVAVATQTTYTTLFNYPGLPSPVTLTGYTIVRTQ